MTVRESEAVRLRFEYKCGYDQLRRPIWSQEERTFASREEAERFQALLGASIRKARMVERKKQC